MVSQSPAAPAVDPLFDQFFEGAKLLSCCLPVNPYRLFLGPATARELFLGRICHYFVLFSQLLVIILSSLFLCDPSTNGGDFLIMAAAAVWLILDVHCFQLTYFSWNSAQELVALFRDLHEIFPKTAEEKRLVDAEGCAQEWKSKMKVQTIGFVMAVVGMVLLPLFKSLERYLSSEGEGAGEWQNQLPLSFWFPFDALQMPVYPLVYLLEIWFFSANAVGMVGVEAILGAVTMLSCLQFKAVAHRFRRIQFGDYQRDRQAMKEAILHHNRILDISTRIRRVFSGTLFLIFVVASIVLCIFMFLIVNEKHAFTRSQYVTNLVCFLVFCSVYLYYGDVLIEHSSSVADAVYGSNWNAADVRIQKMLIIVIRRAHSPQILTGLDFFVLYFPTLSKILTTSYSYFTLLKTTYSH